MAYRAAASGLALQLDGVLAGLRQRDDLLYIRQQSAADLERRQPHAPDVDPHMSASHSTVVVSSRPNRPRKGDADQAAQHRALPVIQPFRQPGARLAGRVGIYPRQVLLVSADQVIEVIAATVAPGVPGDCRSWCA
ncbi:MAG: hypothetical protein ACR2MP_16325 [Streptosporangiaceae bacterium]